MGAGTGLVGFAAAAVLGKMEGGGHVDAGVDVELSDWEPFVLENLRHNLSLNSDLTTSSSNVNISISKLDWSAFPSTTNGPHDVVPDEGRFDTILGADLVYEPQHTTWVHATVSSLLAFPSPSNPHPTFHLVLPLRSTHVAEHTAFDKMFTRENAKAIEDERGKRWRLVTKSREDASGADGFGGKDEARKVGYWVYRIGWEEV
ncbi:hypothetical protein MNV49_007728 [Pseudohyphozyma bogoriensis]|nr:hypothetical protein MNV49_007728 [Pseudohyphozyma bogoriensis]